MIRCSLRRKVSNVFRSKATKPKEEKMATKTKSS